MADRNDLRAPRLGVGQQVLQTLIVPVADDGAVVAARRPCGVKRFDRRVVERHEACQIVLMD
ncbi:hypothetical protein AK51_07640 [Serratia nematodiphila DZ0503SBS1]|nr:hypothetical protein AK51_07640 [Serratia nematodiphila DZ0503SBS1]